MNGKYIIIIMLLASSSSLFSQERKLLINDIIIHGNKTTKEKVINRELTFHKGDSIGQEVLKENIDKSRENLLNTSLFNYVTITCDSSSSDRISIDISVEERWYLWPVAILKYEDRNFSAWLKEGDLKKSEYGLSVDKYNCFGRRETMKVSFLFGYTRQFAFSYKNIALDKNRKHFLGADVEITRQDETIIDTRNNEPVNYRSSFSKVFERRKYTLNYVYRPQIYSRHNFYLNYFDYNVANTILKLNRFYLPKGRNHFECLTFDYVITIDRRDIKAYPLRGSCFEMLVGQTVSMPLNSGSFMSTSIIPSYYRYFEIGKRVFYATGVNLKLSYNNSRSYLFSRSLGYNYNLHGFEYNTIEGQYFLLFKNIIKFNLLRPRVSVLPFIPIKKFNKIHYALYFNLFTDCGYVADKYRTEDNTYSNRFLISTGAGLDLVTYYDRTLRAEYSVNGFGKSGLYLHLTAPLNK
jgi:outer membrane protein assembly factor BamA